MAPPPIPVVVDVVVTRGNVLGPAGYSRVTTRDGGVFDLHRGKDDKSTDISDDAAFLWCRRGAPGETAITSVVRGALENVQVVDLGDGEQLSFLREAGQDPIAELTGDLKGDDDQGDRVILKSGACIRITRVKDVEAMRPKSEEPTAKDAQNVENDVVAKITSTEVTGEDWWRSHETQLKRLVEASAADPSSQLAARTIRVARRTLELVAKRLASNGVIPDACPRCFDFAALGGGGLIAAKSAPVDDILEEASHLESPDQPKKKGSFFGRIRKPSRSLLQAAQASSDVCEPLQEVELRVCRDPPSDDEEEPPDALQGLDPRNPSKYASLAKRHPQQVSFCRGRGTKQGTSHEFLDKGAEGLLKNSEAGCGQMLDHFLICGGLDALLARITPSSGLECSAQKLGELLRAFEIVCDRAAPTTAPHFALSYARHLQRAAHARLRREASSASNTTKQYIDGRWDADEKIRQTCDRLARCLAQLAPDAFGEQTQQTPRSWTQHVASYWASGPSIDARSKALRLSAERFVWAHALTAFDDKERTPDARLKGLRNLSSVVRGCCASEPSEVPPWSSRATRWETSEEVVARNVRESGVVARIAIVAKEDRRALRAGLHVIMLAAQRSTIAGRVVDDLTTLAVEDAAGDDPPTSEGPSSWQCCWALARHLEDTTLVQRQRDVLEHAFSSQKATPRNVHLVARFSQCAAERLVSSEDKLDGGLELLWRWASSPEEDDCQATRSLRHLLRGATHLDSAASLIAQKCVDALGGEDSPGLNRAAELLAALVVASGEDNTYRQPSPVDTRRRRRLRIERGLKTSLLDVAVAGAARHKHSTKSYEASLRLAIELAADALLSVAGLDSEEPLPFLRARDIKACYKAGDDTCARWLAACAERLALEPSAADAALVELANDENPSSYVADAAASLYEAAEQPSSTKIRPPAYGSDSLNPPPPVQEPLVNRHKRVDALLDICLKTDAVSKRRDALLARLATSDLRGRIIARGIDTLRTTNEAKEADRAADIVRRALKGRSSQDAPPGLDAEASQWLLLEGDRGLLGPRLRVAQACALSHTAWFSQQGGSRRAASRCAQLCATEDHQSLRAALRLVASALQRTEADRPPTPPTPTSTFRPVQPPRPPETEDGLDVRALGDERNTLVEALGVYVKQGSDSVARALSGDLLIGLSRVAPEALAKISEVAPALVDVMVAPPATASRAALRLHAVSIAGDFQDCGAALRRASLEAVSTRPSASAAAFASAIVDAARQCPLSSDDETMLSKAVESLVSTDVSDDDEDADAESARLKLLASLLRSGAKAPSNSTEVAQQLMAKGGLDGSAANAQALQALAALCDADDDAARATCLALAELHGPPPFTEDLRDETSVASRLEAADVVRAIPSTEQRFSVERLRVHGPPPLDDRRRERYPSNAVSVPSARKDQPGLDNLGCTCYLNSTLQVICSAPLFRKTVFSLDTSQDSLARELQLLVARMRSRDASSISPRDFIAQNTTQDGEQIDVRIQQDATEFLAKLMQDVERMKSATDISAAKLLQKTFGCVLLQQIKSVNGKHKTEPREVPFYGIPLELGKDRENIEDCLRHYVAPEEVELRFVDGEPMLPSIKTVRIKKAPFNLLLHLKRFQFDLETLSTRKNNSRLEFPHTLDLRPFMSDEGEPILYDLKGVVVHSGTAQSGHYYSFVNTGSQWTEFNDSHVAPFDVSEMEAECFGGYEEVTTDSYGRRSQPRERTRNAFLLSYERRSDHKDSGWASPAPPAAVDERIARENISLRRARAAFDDNGVVVAASVAKAAFSSASVETRKAAALLAGALVSRTLSRARGDDAAARLASTASLLANLDADVAAEAIKGLGLADRDATTALCRRAAQLSTDEAARESLCGACAAVLKSAPSDESLTNLLAVAAECPPPVPGRRAHDYERDASRAACDILARLGAQRGCREVLEGCVKASGGAVSEDALSQTTLRALLEAAPFLGGAFAPRAEAAAALLSADASALDTLSDAQIGALALATCGCLDRGTYSRAGTDEQKRRGAAARAVLKALVVDSTERSKVVISALRGAVERCGTARPDESSASEDEDSDEEIEGWHQPPPRNRLDRGRPYGSSRQLRRACRALAITAGVDDQHKQGRVSLVVREMLQTAETAFRRGARDAKVKAQVDALLKLCKREPRAKAAVLDSGAPRWLEAFAEGREMGGPLSPRGEVPPLTPLHRGARNGDEEGDGEDEDHYHPNLPRRRQLRRELLARIRALPTDSADVVSYDSDDDPNELVGRRIEVRWSGGQFYGGVVIKHDHLGHHVRYDDGDDRVYADILAKTWRFA